MNRDDISITIMAGGSSIRMGRDKAMLEIAGETLLERTAGIALACGRNVAIIGRERPELWPFDEVVFIADDYPGEGPLGALITALSHLHSPVLALPCDLPLLTTDAIRWLLDAAPRNSGRDGLVTIHSGASEPLFSIYNPSALPLARDLLAANRRSLHALHDAGEFGRIDIPAEIGNALRNVNTPEEWGDLRLTIYGWEENRRGFSSRRSLACVFGCVFRSPLVRRIISLFHSWRSQKHS